MSRSSVRSERKPGANWAKKAYSRGISSTQILPDCGGIHKAILAGKTVFSTFTFMNLAALIEAFKADFMTPAGLPSRAIFVIEIPEASAMISNPM